MIPPYYDIILKKLAEKHNTPLDSFVLAYQLGLKTALDEAEKYALHSHSANAIRGVYLESLGTNDPRLTSSVKAYLEERDK